MNRCKICSVFIVALLFSAGCRYNRVSVKIHNKSSYTFDKLITRFGDTLHVIKELSPGETSTHFYSNKTYGKGIIIGVNKKGDTLKYTPLNRHGQKFYYHGKILVKLRVEQNELHHDTLLVSARRRIFF